MNAWRRRTQRWRVRNISSLRAAAGIYQVSLRDELGLGEQQTILVREGEYNQVALTAWKTGVAQLPGANPVPLVQTTVHMHMTVRRVG